MASFNHSESDPTSFVDRGRRLPMKLIANFGVTGTFKKRSGFWRTLCCLNAESDGEVIDMDVPVQNLTKRLHVVVKCGSATINVKMHPQGGGKKEVVQLSDNMDSRRAMELLSTIRCEGCSVSTVFSSAFPEFVSGLVNGGVDALKRGSSSVRRPRINSV